MPSLYELSDSSSLPPGLTERQLRLLEGAVNYHSLISPGTTLTYRVYMGDADQYPILTDISTRRGEWAASATYLGEFSAASTARGQLLDVLPVDCGNKPLGDRGVRYIRLSPTLDNDAEAWAKRTKSFRQRLYDRLEVSSPLVLDAIRESLNRKRDLELRMRKERWPGPETRDRFVQPPGTPSGAPKAILFGLHWFQTGGAERWAVETIAMAREAGFLPVVLTDQLSHHSWIDRPELDGAVLLPLTFPVEEWPRHEVLLERLFENYAFDKVVVHHCSYLYARLWWIKKFYPQVKIIDSTHIIEYKGGGFPGSSVSHDEFIDVHHVISPQLSEWMVQRQGISPEKVVLAPLVGLTAGDVGEFAPRNAEDSFTIAFVGRLARQKRPDIFLLAVQQLLSQYPQVRVILHGDGELADTVTEHVEQWNLPNRIERHGEQYPVADTLAQSDLLLLTSSNEGLALTTLEAIAQGVPVVSTDVGSQRTLVPEDALLPRSAALLLNRINQVVGPLIEDEERREDLWKRESHKLREFASIEKANSWWKRELS